MNINLWSKIGLVLTVSVSIAACSSSVEDVSARNHYQVPTGALENNPTAANYNVQLGMAYLQQGKVERGKQKLQLAMRQDPGSPIVLDGMGYFWEATGEPERAEQYYTKAVSVAPNKGDAQNNYGTFLCRQGRYDEAIQHFMIAVQDPNYVSPAEAYENAGLCAMHIPNEKLAEQYFTRALQKQPFLPNSQLELGKINFKRGDYRAAQQYLNRYITEAGETAEALWLGMQLAWNNQDDITASHNAALLKKNFSDSSEYQEYLRVESLS